MASSKEKAKHAIGLIESLKGIHALAEEFRNKTDNVAPRDNFPIEEMASPEGKEKRLHFLKETIGASFGYLDGKKTITDFSSMKGNIENFIGMTQVPTGVIGPLRVLGTSANGDFYVPLATSEGALVASYHRGAKATQLSGGVTSVCLVEGVQRSPVFNFVDIGTAVSFLAWVYQHETKIRSIIRENSRHAELADLNANIEGNHLILTFEYHTGDASGQNMVTICTNAVCMYLVEHAPFKPVSWYIEGNYSGDKKATALAFTSVRGKKISAECVIPKIIVEKVLKTTPAAMADYWQASTMGVIQSGAIGAQGHVANGLAALFLATGQDVACIAEAAVGITRMQINASGDLYTSVTLPNLIVGTVGGGTALPTQKECLALIGCAGAGKARKFAEICGAVALAGEISIAAALSAGHFATAHQKLGRK
ncbi:MAG TPA: hydroxymethylglutaryl-CoA reductase [Bacteroidia bacterium]|nr:hydroxymethylglutaryl-CoA reductase [Bacteroidia bacterium]